MAPPLHPILPALARSGMGVHVATLVTKTGLRPYDVRRCLKVLERQRLVSRTESGCYRLTESGRATLRGDATPKGGAMPKGDAAEPKTPRQTNRRGLRARAWRAMRTLRKFSAHELLVHAASDGDQQPYNNVMRFIKALEITGYLARLRRDGRRVRWILVRDTGPRTPILRHRQKTLYDPNLDEERSYECA